MAALLKLSRWIDGLNEFVGRWLGWLVLAAVLISAANAIVRKAFDMSSNAFLEIQWYLFSAVFLLCAAYTLLRNEHIRIDVVAGRFSRRITASACSAAISPSPVVVKSERMMWPDCSPPTL